MSTPRPTAQDKFAAMFEKMIDDFCETHSSDEVEAMFAKCDELFGGIEKRQRSSEGVAAPLEPSAKEKAIKAFLESQDSAHHIWTYCGETFTLEEMLAAVSKNLTDKYAEMEAKWMRELLTVSNEIGEARDELARIKKLFHDLTPGGSEFYNDPDYCADYLRKRSHSQHEIAVKSIKRAKELEKEITALPKKGRWNAALDKAAEMLSRMEVIAGQPRATVEKAVVEIRKLKEITALREKP